MLAAAIGEGDIERGVIGRVAAEAEDESAIGRDTHGAAVEDHMRAGIGLAAHEATLLDLSFERQRARPARHGDQCDKDRGGGDPHSSDPWPGDGGFFGLARGCLAASSAVTVILPSWKISVSASPA